MVDNTIYQAPWADRYASPAMLHIFSNQHRYSTWRRLWLYLAQAEQVAGIEISDEQLAEMEAHLDDIDFEAVRAYEKRFKHDVMAHIHAFGDVAPLAKPIIHLGATSCFVTDNGDLMIFKEALKLVSEEVAMVVAGLTTFAEKHKNVACLGFTHFQSAQAITVGKRATLWMQSLLQDLAELENLVEILPFRSVKGATGSAESFKNLVHGEYKIYKMIEKLVTEKAGFAQIQTVSGQTYDRKWDSRIMAVLSHVAESAHKITNDIRLLQGLKELEEPFADEQIGSSAMAYKRNPMQCERISSLSKWVMSLQSSSALVTSTQWLERTLDDSAIRRLTMPQAFLGIDSILRLLNHVVKGLVVYPKIIERNLRRELPYLATEKILMEAVKHGADRQEAHEIIRNISMKVVLAYKEKGVDLDLVQLLSAESILKMDASTIGKLLEPTNFTGFSIEQTQDFIDEVVKPALLSYSTVLLCDLSIPEV